MENQSPRQPMKEFESHGSPSNDEELPLDEVFRQAARDGVLAE